MKVAHLSKILNWRTPAKLIVLMFGIVALTACGGGGGGGSSNVAPVANAGSAQTVEAQTSVTLNGSGSTDADGSISSFRWIQTSGPSVTLSNIAIASPDFTAPVVSSDTVLIFQLTITDNNGTTDSATVSITVRAVATFTLSGIISAPVVVAVDSDTNDEFAPPSISNNTPNQAQIIANPITLGGYVNVPGAGAPGRLHVTGDSDDYYRVELLAGQVITMLVSDFQTGVDDIDLFLFDSTGQVIIDASVGVGEIESVIVPADGEYLVNSSIFRGASNYVLVIGNSGIAGNTLRLSTSFVSGQAVARYNNLTAKQGLTIDSMVSRAGFKVRAGTPGRQMLLELDTQTASPAATQSISSPGNAKARAFRTTADRAKWETLMAIKALRQDPLVEYAEPNYILKATAIPNDEAYAAQWHYPLINLPAAWDLTTGSPNVIVAVIDTGVLFDHPDLQGQFVAGYDFISSVSISGDDEEGIDPNPADPGDGGAGQPSSFHGTHVSGTVAAASNNGIGGAGVAWGVKIMPLRVLGIGGGTSFDVSQAVLYAAGLPNDSGTVPPQRADIINLSLGGGGFSQASQNTFTAARNAGVVVVAAAGNDAKSTLFYPASYNGVISVSAVDAVRQLAPYSNFGAAIDVAAPGGDMRVDRNADGFPDGVLSTGGDDSSGSISLVYPFFNGTSMASPHVAGVIALMKSVNSNLTPKIIDEQLALGALTDDIGSAGRDDSFGHGLINAQKAVTTALILDGMPPPPDNPILGVTPASLNFDAATDTFEITVQNVGTGNLQLTGITPDKPWITVAPVNIDANNLLGTYLVTVDRIGLPDGIFSAQITLQSDANTINIFVILSVGAAGIGGDVGFVYLLLVDADSGEVVDVITPPVLDGTYTYSFSNVAAGAYGLLAGTDADNDFTICDAGEACGAYLTIDQPIRLEVNGDQSNLNFPIGYIVALPTFTPNSDKTEDSPRGLSRVMKPRSKTVAR